VVVDTFDGLRYWFDDTDEEQIEAANDLFDLRGVRMSKVTLNIEIVGERVLWEQAPEDAAEFEDEQAFAQQGFDDDEDEEDAKEALLTAGDDERAGLLDAREIDWFGEANDEELEAAGVPPVIIKEGTHAPSQSAAA
jgi:hypothetical protein